MNQQASLSGRIISIRQGDDPRGESARIGLLQEGGAVLDILIDNAVCQHLQIGSEVMVGGWIDFRDGEAKRIQAHSITVSHHAGSLRSASRPHPCNLCKKAMVLERLFCAHCDVTIVRWSQHLKQSSPLIPILARLLSVKPEAVRDKLNHIPEQARLAMVWSAVNEYTSPAEDHDPR